MVKTDTMSTMTGDENAYEDVKKPRLSSFLCTFLTG